ncbi:MAG: hypothetical protein IKK41_03520 [Oscillospiraceae bacterium]|nr:hypothetical protein [Oscillospiraceae bacterium]
MKKLRITALLIVTAIVLTILSGCTEVELSYTVLDLATVTDVIGGQRSCEVPGWSYEKQNPHEDASAPAEATVEFNGETYTGSYDGSFIWMPNPFVSHCYKAEMEDGTSVDFRINSLTGEMTYISFYNMTEQGTLTEEAESRKIADTVAKNYISLKDYKVKVESFYDNTAFAYTYYRAVSGYETTDHIRIFVKNGVVSNCDVAMAGTFKKVKKLTIDEERATSAIKAKIQQIYGHLDTMTGYTIQKTEWVKAPDGQYGRLYRIDVDFREGTSSYGAIVDLLLI